MADAKYLFSALFPNFLSQTVFNLRSQIRHILQHVSQHDYVAHGTKPARLFLFALAADNSAFASWFGPAAAVGICFLTALLHLDAERVDDAGFVGTEAGSFGPPVFAHQALCETGLARETRSLLGPV